MRVYLIELVLAERERPNRVRINDHNQSLLQTCRWSRLTWLNAPSTRPSCKYKQFCSFISILFGFLSFGQTAITRLIISSVVPPFSHSTDVSLHSSLVQLWNVNILFLSVLESQSQFLSTNTRHRYKQDFI